MTDSSFAKAVFARAALGLTPPLIRETLLADATFRKKYGFKADGILSFAEFDVSVRRSVFFAAIRSVYSGKAEVKVLDTRGRKWKIRKIKADGDLPRISLSRGAQQFVVTDFCALSPDEPTRLRSLDETSSDVNLPTSVKEQWRDILAERALEDEEIDTYLDEFRETPVAKSRSIHRQVVQGKSSMESLVPISMRYFERLVGAYDGSATINDYASGQCVSFFHALSVWRPYEGFLFSLLLSSHSSLTAGIDVAQLGTEELVRAFDFVEKRGDRISQLGAIEVGLRVLSSRPEVEPSLVRIVELIRDDDPNGEASGFKLLSALFIMVDGELSRSRLLSDKPPFYRRLASLTQAALIQRQFVNSGVNINHFCEWALSQRGNFFLQSLTDMRTEPRWQPYLSASSQMREDFLGRIMIAARKYELDIKSAKLFDLILGSAPASLQSRSDFLLPYIPGPLEAAEETQNTLPQETADMIRTQMAAEVVSPSSFIALVNSAFIFPLDPDHATAAAEVLKRCGYRLSDVEDKQQLLSILTGLATVAAVTRSCALADGMRIITRSYRRDLKYALTIDETMRICLVAAASRADLYEWRDFVGDWLTELAFSDLDGHDSEVLYSYLQGLCHAVPELWVSCGRADAALMAYSAAQHP
jgi:hypothetical protein